MSFLQIAKILNKTSNRGLASHALTVGRVAEENPISILQLNILQRHDTKGNSGIRSALNEMFFGEGNGFRINIGTGNSADFVSPAVGYYGFSKLIAGAFRKELKAFHSERTISPRRHVTLAQSGLDKQSAGAAAWVL